MSEGEIKNEPEIIGETTEAIETSPEILRMEIEERLSEAQLEFIRKKHEKEGTDIGELLEKYTCVIGQFGRLSTLTGFSRDALNRIRADMRKKIVELQEPKSEDWTKRAVQIIHNTYEQNPETKNAPERNWPLRFGGVNCEIKKSDNGEDVAELHFPIRAIESAKGNPEIPLSESFSALASAIKSDYPQVKTITTRSWMLGRQDMKEAGFKITKIFSPEESFRNLTYWLQILDKKGDIKQKQLEYLYKNGKLEYEEQCGEINVKDFLEKYLKQEK